MHDYYWQGNQQFLKFSQPAWFYINIYMFLYMMIAICLHTSYNWTQWVLKIIQPNSDFWLESCR